MQRREMLFTLGGMAASLAVVAPVSAEPVTISEALSDQRVFQVRTQVTTRGKLVTSEGQGKTRDLAIEASATFHYRERRLPSAGRDALAYRALREFSMARMQAQVEGEVSRLELPAASAMVVTFGELDGLESYSVRTLLSREQVDLLNMPADPLALSAALPVSAVDTGSEWTVPEWAAQLVAGIEAVSSARLSGVVLGREGDLARLELKGVVEGLQEGAKTTVTIQGELHFDVAASFLRSANVTYKIQSGIGAVSPGSDAEVTAIVERSVAADSGRITDAIVSAIPLEAPAAGRQLVFDAPPWRARLRHSRKWYVFQAVLDAPPRVAILRLVEQGSLICQCNLSPIPDAAPGKHTPIEEFEQDIQQTLGQAFRSIRTREVLPIPEGGSLVRVIAQGEVEATGKDAEGKPVSLAIPMEWRYYIVAHRSGRQMSFVFAVEQALAERLGQRDRELIDTLELLPAR